MISLQGVKEFASRNQDEIAKTKQDLTSELAGLCVVNKQQRLADAQQDLDSAMLCRSFGQPSRRFRPRLHGSPNPSEEKQVHTASPPSEYHWCAHELA